MGKIAPVSAKYIIHSKIFIGGVVDRPDVIGAIFGQTEGLLGADLELRELQRSGRIGRIEVNVNTNSGKTSGEITIPSSLDKAETCIVAAALEIIQRIGPCNAKLEVGRIEDVRISKRNFVVDRAKQLLKFLTENTLPDSQELADEVAQSVRVMEIQEFGRDRLPAGPGIDESDEVIVVEGRADVLNLLKHGIKNTIALNGTSVPQTVIDLSRKKTITAFVDGDRGGDLIIRELMNVADIDFVCKAPDGKEVEEITKKEIHKALTGKIAAEQVRLEIQRTPNGDTSKKRVVLQPRKLPLHPSRGRDIRDVRDIRDSRDGPSVSGTGGGKIHAALNPTEKSRFKSALDDLFGTRGAYIFDKDLNVLGKVPATELNATVRSIGNVHAIVLDGPIDQDLVQAAETAGVHFVVSTESRVKDSDTQVGIVTDEQLI